LLFKDLAGDDLEKRRRKNMLRLKGLFLPYPKWYNITKMRRLESSFLWVMIDVVKAFGD